MRPSPFFLHPNILSSIAQLLVYSNRSQSSSFSAFFSVSGAGQFPHPAIYSLGLLDDPLWAFDKLVVDGVRLGPSAEEFST